MKTNLKKYPRTFHLPWSKGFTSDDKVLKDTSCFDGKSVIVTEKMDGENSTLYSDYYHARSLDSRDHVSRSWLKQFHASIKADIPEGYRICGENMFAKHSIKYDNLKSYFYCFSIWDDTDYCLPWDETVELCELIGIETVPVLYRGYIYNEDVIKAIEVDETISEGYVLRNDMGFSYSDFGNNVAKYVRQHHVQTESHWMHSEITKNDLIKIQIK